MPEWCRDTPWRQGHLLTDEAAKALGLTHAEHPDETVVVVISHDCDLAQLTDREPEVEMIIGFKIQEINGSNTHAKSARTLHITFEDDTPLSAEFVATEKCRVPKDVLVNYEPNPSKRLSPESLAVFQIWLASRYRRSAFPDDFEQILQDSKLIEKIANAVKKHGEMLTAVFFDVDEGREEKKEPDDVYVLDIYLLHAEEPDYFVAEEAARKAENAICLAFKAKLFDKQTGWRGIELRNIEVYSESTLTFKQSKLLKKWRLDHLSLRAEPQQAIVEG